MNNNLVSINKCEVCQNQELIDVLDLGLHPMCDDLVEISEQRTCKEYPIEIAFCNQCYTAHQRFQIPKLELFPTTYHYRAQFTADVLNGMKSLVEDIISSIGSIENKKVLDIGCNDGSLLNFFKERKALTFGIEPTSACKDAIENGHQVINDFFSIETAQKILQKIGKPDIITFTNVFAHIENLEAVIQALKILISPKTIIIIENHYLGSVLERLQFDTFYHEHPRTYSYKSFTYIASSLGLDLLHVSFPSRYGGNIRVMVGNRNEYYFESIDDKKILETEAHFFNDFKLMNDKILKWKIEMSEVIENEVKLNGKLKAKAFPGRSAILVKLLGLDENVVSVVYEKPGSMKLGHFVPGTKIPIESDTELFKTLSHEKVILNLAWHIDKEIEKYLSNNGFKGEIINIL